MNHFNIAINILLLSTTDKIWLANFFVIIDVCTVCEHYYSTLIKYKFKIFVIMKYFYRIENNQYETILKNKNKTIK